MGGQRDRFMVSLSLGVAPRDIELALVAGAGGVDAFDRLTPVAGASDWIELRGSIGDVYADPSLLEYAVDLVGTVRAVLGGWTPSTRATLDLVRFAKAHALVNARPYITPDDIQTAAVPVLAHRVIDATRADLGAARGLVQDAVMNRVVPPSRPGFRW